jgi:hypothetical protein
LTDGGIIGKKGAVVDKLTWKRVAHWDLSSQFQVLWRASTSERDYLIARTGTADKAEWELYFRYPDGTEERFAVCDLLKTAKSAAWFEHQRLARMASAG